MRNHSHKTNSAVTRYRTPSSFKVRKSEATKRVKAKLLAGRASFFDSYNKNKVY
ncbi:MAG: hypothetical protein WC621_04930 [Patescibacteria group bacterium]